MKIIINLNKFYLVLVTVNGENAAGQKSKKKYLS